MYEVRLCYTNIGEQQASVCRDPCVTPRGISADARFTVILSGAQRSEESKAFACKATLSWDETLWILRCTQNDIQPGCRAGYAKVCLHGSDEIGSGRAP